MYYTIPRQNGKSETDMQYFMWMNWKDNEELQLLFPNFEDYYKNLKDKLK